MVETEHQHKMAMAKQIVLAMSVSVILFVTNVISSADPVTRPNDDQVTREYIYISGAVNQPGHYPWARGMTALDAIKTAGGLTKATAGEVIIEIWEADGTNKLWKYVALATGDSKKGPVLGKGARVNVLKPLSIRNTDPKSNDSTH
jgi:hypothetical protein